MMTLVPPSVDSNFDSFLHQLHQDSSRRLEELPKPAPTAAPTSSPLAQEPDAKIAADKAAQIEAQWKMQIKERKRLERERRAVAQKEAVRKKAAEGLAQAFAPAPQQDMPPEPQTPKSLAKAKLRCQEQQREEERERQRQEELKHREQWELNDWGPLFEQNRREIREKHRKAAEDDICRLQYERERMSIEDAAAARFVREVDAECTRRSQNSGHKEVGEDFVNKAIDQERAKERRAEGERQLQIMERRKEELRKDQEYIEWREKVRTERLRQVRLDERDRGGPEVDRLAKIGRDYAREAELHRLKVLEQQRKRAEEHAQERLQGDVVVSPRDILKEAQRKAEQQAQQRAQEVPIKREAEEFDTILARHRLARQQERKRGGMTPRWGLT